MLTLAAFAFKAAAVEILKRTGSRRVVFGLNVETTSYFPSAVYVTLIVVSLLYVGGARDLLLAFSVGEWRRVAPTKGKLFLRDETAKCGTSLL